MTALNEALTEISRDLRQIYKRLDDIELTGFQTVTGIVPPPNNAGEMLIADTLLAWNILTHPAAINYHLHTLPTGAQWQANITMRDGATIGQAAGAQLTFDDTNNELDVVIDGGTDFRFSADQLEVLTDSYISGTGIRATLAGAAGLYVPWITGDAAATSLFGSSNASNNQNAILATSYSAATINAQAQAATCIFGQTASATATHVGVAGWATDAGVGVQAVGDTGTALEVNLTGVGTAIASFEDNGTPVLTIQDGGQADFAEYLRHLGDADTHMRFQADQWLLQCGGVTMIDAVEAASDYVNLFPSGGGRVGIGIATPAEMLHIYHATDDVRLRVETDKANGVAVLQLINDARQWNTGVNSGDNYQVRDVTGGNNVMIINSGSDENTIRVTSTGVGIKDAAPGSLMEWNFATEDLEFVDAGSAGATEQDWIEVQVGGNTGYIRVFAAT